MVTTTIKFNIPKRREKIFQYDAIFDWNGNGYTVTVPKLPGLVTEGDNLKEAKAMVKDAIRCHIEALLKEKRNLSSPFRRETLKVAV